MSYGRMYASGYLATTASTVGPKELLMLYSGTSAVTVVHEVVVGARSSDSQMVTFTLALAVTTNAAGSTQAVNALASQDATFTGNVYGVASSNATGLSYYHRETVNQLNGFHYLPTPECRPILKPGARLVLRRETSVVGSTDIAYDVHILFEEIG